MPSNANKPPVILSIDGGGIRGLIPALVLEDLDRRYRALGGTKPLGTAFRLVAGTSTGGIIAAGLCAPRPGTDPAAGIPAMTPSDLVNLYEKHGAEIFDPKVFGFIRKLGDERYDAAPLERLLKQYLGDAPMSQGIGEAMLTAYNIHDRETVFMKGPTTGGDGDFLFRDAARATSAAPTYFEPARVWLPKHQRMRPLVDGGIFVNHPAMAAYVQAVKLKFDPASLVVLSLGTGAALREYTWNEARHWGLAQWVSPLRAVPLISIMMHGQANATEYHLDKLLNTTGAKRFFRLDKDLVDASDAMDDATPENLANLREEAADIITAHGEDLDHIASLLP